MEELYNQSMVDKALFLSRNNSKVHITNHSSLETSDITAIQNNTNSSQNSSSNKLKTESEDEEILSRIPKKGTISIAPRDSRNEDHMHQKITTLLRSRQFFDTDARSWNPNKGFNDCQKR